MPVFFGLVFTIIKITGNNWTFLREESSISLKVRTSVIVGSGQPLLRIDIFMVVILIIIYLLSVRNPSAEGTPLFPGTASCVLFPTDIWKLVRVKALFFRFSFVPPSHCYLGGRKETSGLGTS